MTISIAKKQKRLFDWNKTLEKINTEQNIKTPLKDKLKLYRNLLAKCWEKESCTDDEEVEILSLEREIEQLVEETRLFSK